MRSSRIGMAMISWLLLFVIAATAGAGGTTEPTESVLRVGFEYDLSIIDPVFTTAHSARNHGYMVYDTLFGVDNQLNPLPQMVSNWEVSSDSLTYTFNLRDGLKFHDGSAVTSDDVIASMLRWSKVDSLGKMLFDHVDVAVSVDEDTFELRLKEPFGSVIDALAKPDSNVLFIMPERVASTPHDEQIEDPIGSGPFIMVQDEYVPGSKIVYVKFEDYVPRDEPPIGTAGGKVAKVDRVEMSIMPDFGTAASALIAGEIDYVLWPPVDMAELFESAENVELRASNQLGSQGYIRFNHLLPPFDNKLARQAVYWAIDQKEYLATIFGDSEFVRESYSIYGADTLYASDAGTEALKGYDLERARALVQQSGYDGRPVVLLDPVGTSPHHEATLVTAANLRKIGFEVEIQAMDLSTMMQRRAIQKPVDEGGWNIFHTGFGLMSVTNPLTSPAIQAGEEVGCTRQGWPGWPCYPALGEKISEFGSATSDEERMRIAAEIQAMALDHGTHAYYGQYLKLLAFRSELDGVLEAPVPVFWNIFK